MESKWSVEAGGFAHLLRRAVNQREIPISDLKHEFGGKEVNGWLRDGSNGHQPVIPNRSELRRIAEFLEVDLVYMAEVASVAKKAIAKDKKVNLVNSKMV